MRYEYLILPPAPAPWPVRLLRAVRALFRHPGRALMLGLLLLFAATQLNGQQAPAGPGGRAALKTKVRAAGYRVIIGLRPNAQARGMSAPGRSAVSDIAAAGITRNLERKGLRVHGRVRIIPAVFGQVSETALDALLDDPNVEYVEPDVPMPLAVRASGPSFRYAEDTPWGVPRVTAPEAWALGGSAAYGAGVKVAYLDSGGDTSHPDLVFAGGYNAVTESTVPGSWADDIGSCGGHGTHVAGTIAARRNNIGVVGVAPEVSLYAVKVFEDLGGSCLAYQSRQIAGIDWAVGNGITVISISIGGSTANTSYQSAIASASALGVYIVASAGNNGTSTLTYPGAYTGALPVGALDAGNNRADYSSYGPKLYLSAPGDDILSTLPGGYGYKSGTSMSTPHVAGVIALLLARYPGITRAQLLARLQLGALDLGAPGRDDQFGWGLSRSRESMEGANPLPQPLTLDVAPRNHRDSVAIGAIVAHADSATVSLGGDNGSTTSWSASSLRPWTMLSSGSGTGNGTLRWSRNPTGLSAGVYVDTITVQAGGLSTAILDSLRIVAPPPGVLWVGVSPGSRSRSVKVGTTVQQADSATVTFSGAGASTATWRAISAKSWTTVTLSAGSGSGMVKWLRNPTGLPVGVYVDTITVIAPGALYSPRIVIDSMMVTPAPARATITRIVAHGSGVDEDQAARNDSIRVDVEPGLPWSVGTSAAWIELSAGTGEGAGWLFWRRDFAGLGYGIHRDSLEFATGVGNDREVFLVVSETVVSGADAIAPDAAAAALFGSASTSALQLQMLDLLGNANGRYDVGDFLAYYDRTGATPGAAMMAKVMELRRAGRLLP